MPEPASITCPECGLTSYHPDDIRERYCGNCHWWTSDPDLGPHFATVVAQADRAAAMMQETSPSVRHAIASLVRAFRT